MTGEPSRAGSASHDPGDVEPLTLAIPNDPAALHSARDCVRVHLHARGVDEAAIYSVDLVLEELVGNALRHGYDGDAHGEIGIVISITASTVRVALSDDARPFDPTLLSDPAPLRTLHDTPLGGRGISMVRRSVGAMRYRREAGLNRLEIDVPRRTKSSS